MFHYLKNEGNMAREPVRLCVEGSPDGTWLGTGAFCGSITIASPPSVTCPGRPFLATVDSVPHPSDTPRLPHVLLLFIALSLPNRPADVRSLFVSFSPLERNSCEHRGYCPFSITVSPAPR